MPILSLQGVQVFAAEGGELAFDGIEDIPSALKKVLSLACLTTAVTTASRFLLLILIQIQYAQNNRFVSRHG